MKILKVKKMKALGRHLILEFYGVSPGILDGIDKVREALLAAAREAGATIKGDFFHKFTPQGVSGVVIIAESHISIHTWPELEYAAVDIFTCGEKADPWKAYRFLMEVFKPKATRVLELDRGIVEEAICCH